jgi:long-chain acyl-CoA synthetase
MLTHGNLGANLLQFEHHLDGYIEYGQGAIFTALPLYHIFALMVNCLSGFCMGLTNHLVRDPRNVDLMVETLARARPNIITGVNTLFAGLAAHPRVSAVDWSDLRLSLGGGTKILPAVSRSWGELTGQPIKVGYGLSETSPIVSIHTMDQREFAEHAGQPVLYTEVTLLDADGNDLGIGEPGEVCVRGPQVMQGYWRRGDEQHQTFTHEGYFRTGDVAIRDEQGNLEIVDRIKDMILVSGFNVYPNEIEAALAEHPGVAESICVGIPDERTGEAVKAFVVPRASPLSESELTQFLRSKLTAYKIPRSFEFRESLPKSPVGKLLRKELRAAVMS